MRRGLSAGRGQAQDLRAAARPPLRPAAFFCAVVPPCFELPPEPDFLPPREEEPGEFAILAARSFDMPLSFSASYCFSFLTLARLFGMPAAYPEPSPENLPRAPCARRRRRSRDGLSGCAPRRRSPGRAPPRGAGLRPPRA